MVIGWNRTQISQYKHSKNIPKTESRKQDQAV